MGRTYARARVAATCSWRAHRPISNPCLGVRTVRHAPADTCDAMSRKKNSLASLLAPEDIRRGDYVAILHEIEQRWSYWCDRQTEPTNVRMLPTDDPEPLKVFEVCLPFVTARKADGSVVTLDIRRHELARLGDGYARRVINRMRHFDRKE